MKIAPQLFHSIASIFVGHVNQALSATLTGHSMNTREGIEIVLGHLESSRFALKCIRRLIVHGFKDVNTNKDTKVNRGDDH